MITGVANRRLMAVKPQVTMWGGENYCQRNSYLHSNVSFITHRLPKNDIKVLLSYRCLTTARDGDERILTCSLLVFMDHRQFDLVGILTAVGRSLPEPRHSLPAATRASPYRPSSPTTVGHILIR
jgi:hypothetical protein